MYNSTFTSRAERDLRRLPKDIQKRIIRKLESYALHENPLSLSKPLVNLPPATHRFRVGPYRIAFYMVDSTIVITRIRHRRDVYRG